MNNSWKRKCDKIKIILFDVSSCFTNQNSSFSWDFMVPVRILPPYCQKLFLRSRHLLDGILQKDNFSQAWKKLQVKKSDFYLMAKIISGLKCTRFHNSSPRFSWLNLIKKTNKWNKSGIQKYKNNKKNIITRCFPRKKLFPLREYWSIPHGKKWLHLQCPQN